MAEYDLPDGPRQLFEAVHKPLADHLGGDHRFRLGGGTALAMRWAHRHSTDVDLFTDGDAYARLYQRRASSGAPSKPAESPSPRSRFDRVTSKSFSRTAK